MVSSFVPGQIVLNGTTGRKQQCVVKHLIVSTDSSNESVGQEILDSHVNQGWQFLAVSPTASGGFVFVFRSRNQFIDVQ